MGVNGLTRFINDNDDVLIKGFRLRDCKLIIDAPNLVNNLYQETKFKGRHDIFGGDMVEYANHIRRFIRLFNKANVELIFVFDGAAELGFRSKTPEKIRRAGERFRRAMSITSRCCGSAILPVSATNVFRSVILDQGCEIVQCIYEADLHTARLARRYKCPILSSDSDFFLIDLPHGMISMDKLRRTPSKSRNGSYHIECDIYKVDRFVSFFPDLRKDCLPLLAILLGNDFVSKYKFSGFLSNLPHRRIAELVQVKSRNLEKLLGRGNSEILKILYYLSGKSRSQLINEISDRKTELKEFILENLDAYKIPCRDDFESELVAYYREGFHDTYRNFFESRSKLEAEYSKVMPDIVSWVKSSMERQVMSQRVLQVIMRNTIPMRSVPDDPSLPSCNQCQLRLIETLMFLTRASPTDERTTVVFDRVGGSYEPTELYPSAVDQLGEAYTIFELPFLEKKSRESILFSFFHTNQQDFSEGLMKSELWIGRARSEEYLAIEMVMSFNDREFTGATFWGYFRMAIMLSYLYYVWLRKEQSHFMETLGKQRFFMDLNRIIHANKCLKAPDIRTKGSLSLRLIHQINQLQNAIISFNFLNAFLGSIIDRIRQEDWFNSSLIYNLTLGLRSQKIQLTSIPPAIYGTRAFDNSRKTR